MLNSNTTSSTRLDSALLICIPTCHRSEPKREREIKPFPIATPPPYPSRNSRFIDHLSLSLSEPAYTQKKPSILPSPTMNIFRLAGDMTHLISILVLLLKIYATKTCSGISLKTQELYALVFVTRYLDLFTDFISVYNTVMKLVFIGSTLAIVWCMRRHPVVRRSYDRELDTFRHYFLVAGCFALALVLHEKFTFQEMLIPSIEGDSSVFGYQIRVQSSSGGQNDISDSRHGQVIYLLIPRVASEWKQRQRKNYKKIKVLLIRPFLGILNLFDLIDNVFWAFSIYLEAVAILPQLVLLQRSGNVDNLTGQYIFFLGAYRAFYILNWIYRYFTEQRFSRWIACISGLAQTALYVDFFYYYFLSWKNNAALKLPA
ncbi:hypothetical protein RHMOL_Rhmol13G0251800 [Rhododendron molle]|uniref:Uncharacterized protein n=1 Tax=Rhododendron molle TaxID=49168 RepID=A0ACC0LC59_RHOML|nr:hypothetical protein RHMOL_Rhmol13G0251800 [Rhododendron molle]